ncbi:LCP family protein [Nocardioides marinus]|uniref:LCP family protein required for cell wall assembly n=1 Tax=Nocardioides marinus TaxID=374514 RepID=A0A7Y9YBQ2_9ACTN|nr:LCP family protein [Nocardioides marinus]NYI09261.1 LCP family protein required for cell wall assembly [Nocardioides marinus]
MPVPSPGSPVQAARTSVAERAARIRFRRALSLMVMTLLAPGSAQLAAGGNRRVGLVALRTWVAMWLLVLVGGVAVALDHGLALTLGSTPWFLLLLRLALLVGAIGWALLFMDAWRLGQPLTLGLAHRRAAVGVNGVLCLSVAGALLFGAHVVGVQRDLMLTMFGSGQVTDAHHGRFNVLLLGGDSGAGRWGLRPDSLTVASIDEVTGRTVLVSLPRNMQNFPFEEGSVMAEQFPEGFDADYLNGVSTWAQDNTELFEGSDNPGIDATISAVEGITGLRINYWAMVNLQGFKDLVDAVGGITLNVRQAIPVGLPHDDFFRYIEPGTRKLSGFETLWYARARYDSDDYSRMARQKCVMNAMLQQVSPSVALRNFQSIAQASSELISTNVPASEVDTFLELALKAKSQKISTLSIVPPMVNTADPDIDLVHRKVTAAIEKAEGTAAPSNGKTSKKNADAPVTGGSLGSLSQGYAANQAGDLASAC